MSPTFYMNGRGWTVRRVAPHDAALVDRTGALCLATTDPETGVVSLSSELSGSMLSRVLVHEVAHCAMVSYGLLDSLHEWCAPGREIEAEEWACNLLADYGLTIIRAASSVVGPRAWDYLPREFERVLKAG